MSTILAMLDTELRAGGATTAVMVLVAAGVPLWSEVFGTPEARAQNTVTLTASNVEIKTATLTISGHTGDWWYLREFPFPQPACASAGSSSTVNVTGLKASTTYHWRAYSDSGCSVDKRLTSSLTSFTTKPPTEPSAPTGLTAEAGNTSVTLSWTPGDDGGAAITKWQYQAKAGEGAYGQWQDICSDCPSQTSHTISSLTNGTAYTFQVRAVNNVGNGTAASTTVTPLAALTVSGITTTGAKLTISDHTGNWYYKYITPRGGNCSLVVSGTSANLSGLQAGTDYAFRAYSDASCGSMLSTPTNFTTLPPAPAAPTLSVALGRILVRWVPGFVRGATKYQTQYRATGYDYSSEREITYGGQPMDHEISTSGTLLYTVRFRAGNAAGWGPWSNETSKAAVCSGCSSPPTPGKVAGVSATPGNAYLDVNWTAQTGPTDYEVQWKSGQQDWDEGAGGRNTVVAGQSSYRISGLSNGTSYTIRVAAFNGGGTGAWSDLVTATPAVAPDPVASVTAMHNGSSLDVTWPAAARAASYHVTYSGDNGISWQLGAAAHTSTSLTINGADGTKSYMVAVRAKNTAGYSGWTNSAAATFTAPDAVASVTVVHNGSTLDVTWPESVRAASYHVTYTGDNGTSWQLGASEHVGTSLTINGVDSSKTYLVGVRAKNAAGYSGWVNSAPAAPPALSVANATAAEPGAGQSATLDFVVTLNRAASGTVSVNYATSDGTATAGADYTAASGTLSFAAGETSKTVPVTVLNDAHDEGSETLTLTLSNATGAVIADGEATGTITNTGPIPQAWISRFGRTVADQVLEAVDTRLRSAPTPGLEVTLAGERLRWSADADGSQPLAQLAQWLVVGNDDNGDIVVRTVNGRELLANSSFALSSRTAGGGLLSFWGRGAITSFEGREGELSLDGEVTTWMLGTDWSWGQWQGGEARRSTAGLLLSRSTADGGYARTDSGSSGDVASTLTGVFPWARHRFTNRLEVWGAAGYGQGDLEVTPKQPGTDKDGATIKTDLNLWMAAGGLRGTLLDGGNDGLTLTGTTDAMAVGTTSERVTGLEAAQATVTRLRLGLEAQRPFPLGKPESGSGATLTPSLELGLRHDGGDAETGFGLDLGGGIVFSHPERGLQAELRGRGLLTHAAEGFRDHGFSGSLSWRQKPDSDLGAALSLSQTMGGSSSGGADALLSRVTLEGLAANDDGDDGLKNQRLEVKFGYGFPVFGDRFTLTPELGLGLYDSGRDYRIGWRLTRLAETGAFDLSFDVTRQESVNNDGTAPDHGVQLEVNTRF